MKAWDDLPDPAPRRRAAPIASTEPGYARLDRHVADVDSALLGEEYRFSVLEDLSTGAWYGEDPSYPGSGLVHLDRHAVLDISSDLVDVLEQVVAFARPLRTGLEAQAADAYRAQVWGVHGRLPEDWRGRPWATSSSTLAGPSATAIPSRHGGAARTVVSASRRSDRTTIPCTGRTTGPRARTSWSWTTSTVAPPSIGSVATSPPVSPSGPHGSMTGSDTTRRRSCDRSIQGCGSAGSTLASPSDRPTSLP